LSDSVVGVLSTLFDVGGILVARIFDHLDAQALTTASFTFSAIPSLFFYDIYRNMSLA
jgi:MFS transporter, OPA family, solute carrier family 37 (glycerol-3-phosphate transporter), member 1/2